MNDRRIEAPSRIARCPRLRAVRQALSLVLVLVLPGGAQKLASGLPPSAIVQYAPLPPGPLTQFPDQDAAFAERRLRALNAERQKQMVSDAAKLLKLASELNAEVSSGNFDSLTLAQLHKVAEIEKLARSVREKMSFSVGDEPIFRDVPASRPR